MLSASVIRPEKVILFPGIDQVKITYISNFKKQTNKQNKNKNTKKAKETKEEKILSLEN